MHAHRFGTKHLKKAFLVQALFTMTKAKPKNVQEIFYPILSVKQADQPLKNCFTK